MGKETVLDTFLSAPYTELFDIAKAEKGSSKSSARPREPGEVGAGAKRKDWMDPGAAARNRYGVGVAGGAPLKAQAHAERPRAVRGPDTFGMKKGGTTEKPRP